MPQIKELIVYQFNELSDDAKERARDWYREGALDYQWWDCIYDDARAIGAILGIDIDDIWFRGFFSQGDGACFEGRYEYKPGSVKSIKAYAPKDERLHRIAENLRDIQRPNFYQLSANVKQSGHYMHEGCTEINVYRDGDYADEDTHDTIAECLRDFMRWIYRQLESEYEYQMSDECVDELIEANEYEFDAYGNHTVI